MSGNSKVTYKTKTWSVEGAVQAYRYFKIIPTKEMPRLMGLQNMSPAGLELYGVLSVIRL